MKQDRSYGNFPALILAKRVRLKAKVLGETHGCPWFAEAQLAGATREEAEARFPEVDLHVMDVNFENLADEAERTYFMNLPTSFVLKEEAVDRLRGVGGKLLRQSPVYQEMLEMIGGAATE